MIGVVGALVAAGSEAGAADAAGDAGPIRSGWYLAAGLGTAGGPDVEQEGWNRDTFCYPDAACFDRVPAPTVPGYRWRYDVEPESGAAYELSLGRFFGRTRIELAFAQQENDTRQRFTGIEYFDGAAIRARPGGTVASNGRGSIDRRRVRSITLDAFYGFPGAWGSISPYIGAGLGQASVEVAGVRFATDYRGTAAAAEVYDPALALYNSVQDADLDDTAFLWRLHAGADYALSRKATLGLRLTWSATGDFASAGSYETHPMHESDPDFSNINTFGGARIFSLMLAFRRGIGD